MAKKKLSKASKRRILLAQQKRAQRELDRISAKLESCMTCSVDTLRRDLGRIERDAERERLKTISRLGLRPEDVAEIMSPGKVAKKKASKKAASKKSAASVSVLPPAPARSVGETSPGKSQTSTSKKTSRKKSSKKKAATSKAKAAKKAPKKKAAKKKASKRAKG